MRRACVVSFALVGLVACGSASGQAPASGLSGRVLAAPSCPVERLPPLPGCAARPLAVSLSIRRLGAANAQARSVRSASDGRFHIRLPAGTYTVRALRLGGRVFPRPPAPLRVRVHPGRFTAITISYDTGIR
jgi:hypothetical protein